MNRKVVEVAQREADKKVKETPPSSNRGPDVDKYTGFVGRLGIPWCAAFVSWCFNEAYPGKLTVGKQMSAIMGIWTRNATRKDFLRYTEDDILSGKETIQPGDLFIQCSNPEKTKLVKIGRVKAHTGHVGICTGIIIGSGEDLEFETIEGNTNGAGSRDGGAVLKKERKLNDPKLVGFVRYTGESK